MVIQRCWWCDEPTDKSEEDAFYAGDIGPLCEECYDKANCHHEWRAQQGTTTELFQYTQHVCVTCGMVVSPHSVSDIAAIHRMTDLFIYPGEVPPVVGRDMTQNQGSAKVGE